MNRLATTCLAAFVAITHLTGSAYAAPDEDLYILQHSTGNNIKLTKVALAVSGSTTTDIVSWDSTLLGIGYTDVIHHDDVFYILGYSGSPATNKLWTLNTSNGALTLIDELNIDYSTRLFKNPADDTTWVAFDYDNDGSHLPEAVAQIDLATAEVDTDTTISLPSPRYFSTPFFDAYGELFGMEYSANTYYGAWWFKVDQDTGAVSPDCPPGGGFAACWEQENGLHHGGNNLAINPDTNQTVGFEIVYNNYYTIWTHEFYDSFMTVNQISDVDTDHEIIGVTFAPNVQNYPWEPPTRPELIMTAICELG